MISNQFTKVRKLMTQCYQKINRIINLLNSLNKIHLKSYLYNKKHKYVNKKPN